MPYGERNLWEVSVRAACIWIVLVSVGLCGCQSESRGFALPPGDDERGKATFVKLGCPGCHSVTDVVPSTRTSEVFVELGGPVTRVKTYGDLVTSIINPSHRFARGTDPRTRTPEGESKMPTYNSVMTVQELVDLTAFLAPQYSVWSPQYVAYRYF